LSVDPLTKSYPMLTPYQFASNRPINGIDLDGLEWVLSINSPDQSVKLSRAIQSGNIVEQRRITYWSLNNKFEDTWAAGKSESFETKRTNMAATLIYDPLAEDGLTVYLNSYKDNKGKVTDDPDLAASIGVSDEIHFNYPKESTYDWLFPVDLALWNSNDEISDGSIQYGDNDVIGRFGESLLFGNGKGALAARIRGYGYLEFDYSVSGLKASMDAISYGPLTGKYSGSGATPSNSYGKFSSFVGLGTINPNTGDWKSYDGTWKGSAPSIGVSLGKELGVNLKVNTNIKREFTNSSKQQGLIDRWIKY
jgi:hypothetical protein